MRNRNSPRPDTWMPWYIGDFLRDTMHLDHVSDGAYRRLIDACWVQKGCLSDDNVLLARITKLSPHLWKKIRPIVAKFFIIDETGWRHKRVTEELDKALGNIDKLSTRGAAAAQARWRKPMQQASRKHRNSNAKRMLGDAPSPSPSPLEESETLSVSSTPPESQHQGSDESPKSAQGRFWRAGFAGWWNAWPHKVGKAAAEAAYMRALKRAAPEALSAGIARYIASKPPDRPWCNPATWLNQDRWLDEPALTNGAPARNGHDPPRREETEEDIAAAREEARQDLMRRRGGNGISEP